MAGAGLWGGWLLNPYARIPGLPSTAAGIMALAIYIAALSGPSVSDVSGGAMFMVLMLSVVVRSWQIGIAATAILAGAQVLALHLVPEVMRSVPTSPTARSIPRG
jgi:hypothetical protein